MTSEIRINTIKNRVGLGTISLTSTGPIVSGITTLKDDVEFYGSSDSNTVKFDKSDNSLKFIDGAKAKFGTSNDLEVYHDGSHSHIREVGTGDLRLRSSKIQLMNENSQEYFVGTSGGSVELYHNDTKRLETTSTGVLFSGNVDAGTGNFLTDDDGKFFAGTAGDLQIYHSSNNSFIKNTTGTLNIQSDTLRLTDVALAHVYLKGTAGAATELYHDNLKKLETYGSGIIVYGPEGQDGRLNLYADEGDDNADKWRLQADANGYFYLQNYASGSWETNIATAGNDSVQLYYANTKTFETSGYGIRVLGPEGGSGLLEISADEADDNNDKFRLAVDPGAFYLQNYASGNWENNIRALSNGTVDLYYDNNLKLSTSSTGISITGIPVATQSTGNIGLELHATGSGRGSQIKLHNDHGVAYVGTAGDTTGDLIIYNETSSNSIFYTAGTERLRITSTGAVLLGATVASNAEQFRIHTSDSGKAIIKLTNSTTGTGSGDGFEFGMNGNEQIEFVNKENTDMFFATNNTERLRIDSNGDLNLGNNPTNQYGYKLNIQDTSILYAQTASDGNGTELKLNLDHGNTVATFGTVSSSHLSFVTGNTERLRIKSNGTITSTGYMGVGTDNPQVRLHVHNGSNNLGTTIRLSQDYNSVYSAIASNFGGSMSLHAGQGSVNAIMHFTINGEEKMRIKSGGGLKLDNTASGNLFEYGGSSVYGNSAIDIYRLGQGYADLRLSSNYGVKIALAGASNNTDEFVLQQDNSKNVYIKNEASQPIYFQTGSSNTTRVAIKHSGAGGVDISGEAAYNDANSGARGIDISYNASTSIPVYFGTETNVAQKSMYLKGYWIYLRGHVNEGIRFNFSQSSGAPHSDMYQFKYNSATRPGGSNTWDGFSDARAKENVVSITNGIETIKKLRPVTFDWTNDYADSVDMYVMGKDENGGSVARKENGYDTDMKNGRYGFIAQEYETVLPKDVKQDKFTLGDTEINDFRTINHDSLIPTLTAALKEAVAKIEVLEERISALEGS